MKIKFLLLIALMFSYSQSNADCAPTTTQQCDNVTTTTNISEYSGNASCWADGIYISQYVNPTNTPIIWLSTTTYTYNSGIPIPKTHSCIANVPFSRTVAVTTTQKVCKDVTTPVALTPGCNSSVACSTYMTNVSTSNMQSVVPNAQSYCGACGITASAVPSNGPYFSGYLNVYCGH